MRTLLVTIVLAGCSNDGSGADRARFSPGLERVSKLSPVSSRRNSRCVARLRFAWITAAVAES